MTEQPMIERLERMLEAGRDDAMLRFGLGSALFNAGRLEEAAGHLEKCIEQDPDYSAAYKLLGRAWFQLGRHDQAVAVFEAGLPVAAAKGDKQSGREMEVFMKKARNALDPP